jgi:hypothetical protein
MNPLKAAWAPYQPMCQLGPIRHRRKTAVELTSARLMLNWTSCAAVTDNLRRRLLLTAKDVVALRTAAARGAQGCCSTTCASRPQHDGHRPRGCRDEFLRLCQALGSLRGTALDAMFLLPEMYDACREPEQLYALLCCDANSLKC